MATITKIEGWAMDVTPNWVRHPGGKSYDPEQQRFDICTKKVGNHDDRAVIFIGDGNTPPVVLTEDEHREKVMAMLMEILLLKKGTLARPVNLVWEQDIKAIAAKYGITLET